VVQLLGRWWSVAEMIAVSLGPSASPAASSASTQFGLCLRCASLPDDTDATETPRHQFRDRSLAQTDHVPVVVDVDGVCSRVEAEARHPVDRPGERKYESCSGDELYLTNR